MLILTSSFPSSPGDETCGYIRDFARSLSEEFTVKVLAPPGRGARRWPGDVFTLTRSRSLLPRRFDPFRADTDLNQLASSTVLVKLCSIVSLTCFFARAFAMALQADTICSHWLVPCGLVGALISRTLGKPHVVIEHSGAVHLLARLRGDWIARFIIASSERVVTVSADLKRKLTKMCPVGEAKVDVVPMGIQSRQPRAREVDGAAPFFDRGCAARRTILFIGRLTEIKGLDVLLKAMTGLEDVRLIVAGDGERRAELESLSSELALDTIFIGRVGAKERGLLLSACDVVVIPSRVLEDGRTEGMPLVCLEAMAAGRLVIASKAGGLAEVISDGENGLLFEPGDDRMLREKLRLALGDEGLWRRISESARRTAAQHDWSFVGLRFREIIKSASSKNDASSHRRIEAGCIHG